MDQKKTDAFIAYCRKEKQAAGLRPVKSVFSIWAGVALLVAVIELAAGAVGHLFDPDSNILEIMLINASVWLIMFLVSMFRPHGSGSEITSPAELSVDLSMRERNTRRQAASAV